MRLSATFLTILLLMPATSAAQTQEQGQGPSLRSVAAFQQIDLRPASDPASDPEHPAKKVTDTKFWLTAAALNVAMIADTKSTFDVIRRCDICYEKNPYAAPFVARGPALTYAAGEALDVGVMVVAAKMKGSQNKFYRRTWWVIPIAMTTGHVIAYRHNLGVGK
jgi:hypothetical protein